MLRHNLRTFFQPLKKCIKEIIQSKANLKVLIAATIRNWETWSYFNQLCISSQLEGNRIRNNSETESER